MNPMQCKGWRCRDDLIGCSKYGGKGMTTRPCIFMGEAEFCTMDGHALQFNTLITRVLIARSAGMHYNHCANPSVCSSVRFSS